MTPIETIMAISDQIAREFSPMQIILFGSYAYGKPRPDSDVDLLVVMPHDGNNVYQAIEILNRISPPFPIDLLVRTLKKLSNALNSTTRFCVILQPGDEYCMQPLTICSANCTRVLGALVRKRVISLQHSSSPRRPFQRQ